MNLLPEANKSLLSTSRDATAFVLVSAPGSRPFASLGDSTDVVQLYSLDGHLFAWSRKGFYEVDSGRHRLILDRNFGPYIEVDDGVRYTDSGFRQNFLFFADRGQLFIYNLQTRELNMVDDPDLRPVHSLAHISNYLVLSNENSDQFQWSNLADFGNIQALSFATADGSSDKTLHIEAFEGDLLHFGEKTLEVWRVTADPDNPFQRLTNATLEIGCAHGATVQKLTRDIYWVSDDLQVYRTAARSYQAVPISLHQNVDHDLKRYGVEGAYAYATTHEGHSLYHLALPAAKRTWVYDEATSAWHERTSEQDTQLTCNDNCEAVGYGLHIARSGTMHNHQAYIGGTGAVYRYDLDYFRDDDALIMKEAAAGPFHLDPAGIHIDRVELQFQNACRFEDTHCDLPVRENDIYLWFSRDLGKTWRRDERLWFAKDVDDYYPAWHDLGRGKAPSLRWRTYYDGQVVFLRSVLDVEALTDGRM